jgi:formylglycine-generating enzyme required for sulfatase activity
MARARSILSIALLAGCASSPAPAAKKPEAPAAWSLPLAVSDDTPPDARDGRVVLHVPGPARIGFPASMFTMGSTEQEATRALELCQHEPLARELCRSDSLELGKMLRLELFAHPVSLSAFRLDRTEVSVAAYARCVASGACSVPAYPSGDPRFDVPDFPVTHVAWRDAFNYCAWIGGRLPTEAEWEFAARGSKRRRFPWGEQWAGRRANHGAWSFSDSTDGSDGYVGLAPVDSFPDGATPEGIVNLAGNAAEWVYDLVERTNEDAGYAKLLAINPRGGDTGAHVFRGGSYRRQPLFLRTTARALAFALPYDDDIGFRCAYDS